MASVLSKFLRSSYKNNRKTIVQNHCTKIIILLVKTGKSKTLRFLASKCSFIVTKCAFLASNRQIYSLKNVPFSLNIHFWHFQRPKNNYFCKNIFAIFKFLQNTAIFVTFKNTEIIAIKLDQNFCKKIILTRILIEYLIMITDCIALVSIMLLRTEVSQTQPSPTLTLSRHIFPTLIALSKFMETANVCNVFQESRQHSCTLYIVVMCF